MVDAANPCAAETSARAGSPAEALFNEFAVDGFFMEWDDARSGGFEPLRFLPKGKIVVLGLVTTKHGELEDRDALLRRIEEAVRYADLDQLCLSPQRGSTFEGNALTREQQADKLRLISTWPRRSGADRSWCGLRFDHRVLVGFDFGEFIGVVVGVDA